MVPSFIVTLTNYLFDLRGTSYAAFLYCAFVEGLISVFLLIAVSFIIQSVLLGFFRAGTLATKEFLWSSLLAIIDYVLLRLYAPFSFIMGFSFLIIWIPPCLKTIIGHMSTSYYHPSFSLSLLQACGFILISFCSIVGIKTTIDYFLLKKHFSFVLLALSNSISTIILYTIVSVIPLFTESIAHSRIFSYNTHHSFSLFNFS